ncbi:MAG: DUF5309 family protein [Phycisphaerae bacterium]|jgi:hypothetical protein
MSFTGKATYSAGSTLPELAEDVSDLIGIISPYETPLLDALGDSLYEARSTHHEWLEDELLPNRDTVSDASIADPLNETSFDVANPGRFHVGDQIQVFSKQELMLVTAINDSTLTVIRGYAGTEKQEIYNGNVINILGNAALEGDDKPDVRFTNRVRKGNYTQIFTKAVEVSGTDIAAGQLGLADEMDYQKQQRLRELVRDLESTVINGGLPTSVPQGSTTIRRSMNGIIKQIATNVMDVNDTGFPPGGAFNENTLNLMLRRIWDNSNGSIDLIVVNGFQKRMINAFTADSRTYVSGDTKFSNMISVYESDFGVCRVVTSRWVPQDTVLLLDSSRIKVLPLSGRSFHFKPLASSGDYECGELIGEYTLEMKNESAHGLVRNLATT